MIKDKKGNILCMNKGVSISHLSGESMRGSYVRRLKEDRECKMSDRKFEDITVEKSEFRFITLYLSSILDCNFNNNIFHTCIFQETTIERTLLVGNTFEKSSFYDCTFDRVIFAESHFVLSKFVSCKFLDCDFRDIVVDKVCVIDCEGYEELVADWKHL